MKLYVTRKFIMANSARDAIRKEKNHHVDDVWIQEDWFEREIETGLAEPKQSNIGFVPKKL
jgi:hypothetical protein